MAVLCCAVMLWQTSLEASNEALSKHFGVSVSHYIKIFLVAFCVTVHCGNKNNVLSLWMNRGCEEKKGVVLSQTPEIFSECSLSSPHAHIVPLTHPVSTQGKHWRKPFRPSEWPKSRPGILDQSQVYSGGLIMKWSRLAFNHVSGVRESMPDLSLV